jgi:hypothetical protein
VRHVTNWQDVADADFEVPPGADPDALDALTAELAEALADPDPAVRDGAPYAVLATWLERGVLDRQLAWLGETMTARLSDPRGH